MKHFALIAVMLLAIAGRAVAVTLSPLPYYLLNPYDDVVVGPGFLLTSGSRRLALGAGYSLAQGEARGFFRFRDDAGLAPRLGYQVEGFHQVQQVADVVCRYQTGFYEGRTGVAAGLVRGLGRGEEAHLTFSHEKLWALARQESLRPTTSDRVEALSAGYRRDTRDDPLNPRTGECADLGVTRAAHVFGGTRAYLLARGTWAQYQPLGTRGVQGWRLRAAATTGGIPTQRQIWLPSEGVRGFHTDSLNGDLAGVANGELRFRLLRSDALNFGPLGSLRHPQVALFGDAGVVRLASRTWKARAGMGVGLRAVFEREALPTMVLRLDVSRGLDSGGVTRTSFLIGAPELF